MFLPYSKSSGCCLFEELEPLFLDANVAGDQGLTRWGGNRGGGRRPGDAGQGRLASPALFVPLYS